MTTPGKLWGVGLGPGDPELVTVKAARVIEAADVVAFHSARHGHSISRGIAATYMRPGQREEHLIYPVTTETTEHPGGYPGAIEEFYTEAAQRLAAHLAAGRNVALLAAGDPLFYSSYMHMHRRLSDRFATEIIPGITSVSAASAALATPLVEGDEVLTVLPGTMEPAELTDRLRHTDAAAILKLGRTFPAVRQALADSGRLGEAAYIERASTGQQRVLPAAQVAPSEVPYFSLAVVPGPAAARGAGFPAQADLQANPEPTNPAQVCAAAEPAGAPTGSVTVVGLGPGAAEWTTPQVNQVLTEATDIVGYRTYIDRVPARAGQRRHASDNRVESERAAMALDLARRGATVAVVSSGDPGVFAMAAAVLAEAADPQWAEVPVRILPGVTAAHAVASRVGAPLGHDYAVISLSDRLKPWEVIAQRLAAVAAADMAIAVYNPASSKRTWQVEAMRTVLLAHRPADTPVIVGRDVGGPGESVRVVSLAELDPAHVDMRTLLIIGASTTTVQDHGAHTRVYTSRRYQR